MFKALLFSIIVFFSGACDNYVGQQAVRIIGDSNHTTSVFMGYYGTGWGNPLIPEQFESTHDRLSFDFWWARNGLNIEEISKVVVETDSWLPVGYVSNDLILIGLGTNWNGSSEQHIEYYEELIKRWQNRGNVLILETINGTHSEIYDINRDIRYLAEKYGTVLLDWEKVGKHYLSADGIHYTPTGWSVHSYYGLATLDAIIDQCTPIYVEKMGAR